VNSIGAYQGVNCDALAVLKVHLYAISVIDQVSEPMSNMEAFGGEVA
jgi:hypothetical protein